VDKAGRASTRKFQNYGGGGIVDTANPKTTEETGKLGLRTRREGCPRTNPKTTEEGKLPDRTGRGSTFKSETAW